MRARSRRLLLAAACAVAAFAIVLPGPATIHHRTIASSRDVPVAVTILRPAGEVTAAPREVTTVGDGARREVAAVHHDEVAPARVDPIPPAGSAGPTIRVIHAERDHPAPAPDGAESGPCAKASTCPDFQLRPARWPADPTGAVHIQWKFNDEGRRNLRAPAGLLESTVRSAMWEWSRWDSNIAFTYGGTTTQAFGANGKDGSCADGTNTVTWDRFDPEIIAVAGICTDNAGRVVRDADLALNVTYHWEDISGEPRSRHSFDIRSIVTHELGHWLGLLDLYSPSDVHQTMSGFSEYSEHNKRTPALGDIMGIQKEFPCDAKDRCPREGIADD